VLEKSLGDFLGGFECFRCSTISKMPILTIFSSDIETNSVKMRVKKRFF
jgi:hypothetical protein